MASIVPKAWKISRMKCKPGESVSWDFGGKSKKFVVWFPSSNNPMANGNEFFSNPQGKVSAQVKPDARLGTYPYSILLTEPGEEDVVAGENSPPEMEIG